MRIGSPCICNIRGAIKHLSAREEEPFLLLEIETMPLCVRRIRGRLLYQPALEVLWCVRISYQAPKMLSCGMNGGIDLPWKLKLQLPLGSRSPESPVGSGSLTCCPGALTEKPSSAPSGPSRCPAILQMSRYPAILQMSALCSPEFAMVAEFEAIMA